jgi:imidazolonepropionase-like amidohydrolase
MKMLLRQSLFVFFFSSPFFALFSQTTFPKPATSDEREGVFAFTNAVVYTDYKTRVEGAVLVIRNGKVEACGKGVVVPKDAVVTDCSGKTIYPSFIDLYAMGYGLPGQASAGAPAGGGGGFRLQSSSSKTGAYAWNDALKTDFNLASSFVNDTKAAEEWRKYGFGTVLTHRADGISRGTGALTALTDKREHEVIMTEKAANFLSFRKGSSTQSYPSSLMGCIALLRQTYLDAQWYKTEGHKAEKNLSLEAWNAAQGLPQIFEATDKLDILRAAAIGKEFGVKYIIKTNGDEYQRLDEVKTTGSALIVPLVFPEAFSVTDPYEALNFPLKDLKHWEMAPANPARIDAAGIPFALTTAGLKDKKSFLENLRKAIEHGLSEEAALKALTYTPASMINAYASVGSLESGKTANFIVATGNIFKADTKILHNWVKGKGFEVTPMDKILPQAALGQYRLEVGKEAYTLSLKGKPEAPEAQIIKADSSKAKAAVTYNGGLVTISFQQDTVKKGMVALSGAPVGDQWVGNGTLQDGAWVSWRAVRNGAAAGSEPGGRKPAATTAKPETGDLIYPFTAFGWREKPKASTILVQNATVWTNEREGILQNADVLVVDGKIRQVGTKLAAPAGANVVDGTGKHLTAGIIDEHSHIAASRSINEGSQESSAEVRIGDVIDSEDTDIYRQLAGGVTGSHILHGSANPIGGQTQLIKLRWGYAPEALKFENWPGQIKFALGENVKRSNFNVPGANERYPQTRMGVEQTFDDYFTRAREYGKTKAAGKPYRKDIELEALLEILENKRFITCHSYVQSEIVMMIRVAERFGFKLNTFTHILEGYKVADKMARHGAGGSTFSDWWAYKYEVYEAIPYNAKMMHDRGVVVAINSDDAEMARRLNQEAGKSILNGGMKEEDAWKMVTLNPAKLLHVDDRTGSLKAGKDADLVLWNANPLSVYARAEKTWVDGMLFFDREEDVRRQTWVRSERARIIQKMQAAAPKGGEAGGGRPGAAPKKYYHCDSDEDEGR